MHHAATVTCFQVRTSLVDEGREPAIYFLSRDCPSRWARSLILIANLSADEAWPWTATATTARASPRLHASSHGRHYHQR